MSDIPIHRNGEVDAREIESLRDVVGWDRCEGIYEQILKRHFSYYIARNEKGALIGYLSVLSDEIADAFLLDLMVHPNHQHLRLARNSFGRQLRMPAMLVYGACRLHLTIISSRFTSNADFTSSRVVL